MAMHEITLENIPLVSADSHVSEPIDVFLERLPGGLKDRGPRVIEEDGQRRVVFPTLEGDTRIKRDPVLSGEDFSAEELKRARKLQKMAESNERSYDPKLRLQDSDRDGVLGEVVHPSMGLAFGRLDADLGTAMCHIYNEWLIETFRESDRIVTPAMIPMWEMGRAIEELDFARDSGVRVANIPVVPPDRPYNSRMYEAFWERAAELGMTFVMHNGSGHDMVHYRGLGSGPVNLARTGSLVARTLGLLASSGVMERYPDMHFVGVECEGGWFAWLMQVLDEAYDDLFQYPRLAHKPSYYLRRQAHVTFQDDPVAIHNIPLTGPDVLLWGSDYPHMEGTFPESRAYVQKLFGNTPLDVTRKVVGETAARIFGLEHVLPDPVAQ
jgi:predicted TIM-barrel fold metal-dependent hydrolase